MSNPNTDALIDQLARNGLPVRRLAAPWKRTAIWFAIGVPYVALIVGIMVPRNDLAMKATDVRYLIEQIAALATSISAAAAAFAMIVPGYSRRLALIPLIPLGVWLVSLGEGCIETLARDGWAPTFASDFICIPAIALVGTVPALAMAMMLRRGAPLQPRITAALGGLAAAGIGNFGLRLFHHQDASLMVLIWQMGTVCVLTLISGWVGRVLLDWRPLIGKVRRSIDAF